MFDLVVEQHSGCCDQVGYEGSPNVAQGILVEGPPWRVGSTEEDGLDNVSKLCCRWPISGGAARRSCRQETYVIATRGMAFLVLLVAADKVADLLKQRLAFHCSTAWLIVGEGKVPGGRVSSRRLGVGTLSFQDCRLT